MNNVAYVWQENDSVQQKDFVSQKALRLASNISFWLQYNLCELKTNPSYFVVKNNTSFKGLTLLSTLFVLLSAFQIKIENHKILLDKIKILLFFRVPNIKIIYSILMVAICFFHPILVAVYSISLWFRNMLILLD